MHGWEGLNNINRQTVWLTLLSNALRDLVPFQDILKMQKTPMEVCYLSQSYRLEPPTFLKVTLLKGVF